MRKLFGAFLALSFVCIATEGVAKERCDVALTIINRTNDDVFIKKIKVTDRDGCDNSAYKVWNNHKGKLVQNNKERSFNMKFSSENCQGDCNHCNYEIDYLEADGQPKTDCDSTDPAVFVHDPSANSVKKTPERVLFSNQKAKNKVITID